MPKIPTFLKNSSIFLSHQITNKTNFFSQHRKLSKLESCFRSHLIEINISTEFFLKKNQKLLYQKIPHQYLMNRNTSVIRFN